VDIFFTTLNFATCVCVGFPEGVNDTVKRLPRSSLLYATFSGASSRTARVSIGP